MSCFTVHPFYILCCFYNFIFTLRLFTVCVWFSYVWDDFSCPFISDPSNRCITVRKHRAPGNMKTSFVTQYMIKFSKCSMMSPKYYFLCWVESHVLLLFYVFNWFTFIISFNISLSSLIFSLSLSIWEGYIKLSSSNCWVPVSL